METTQQFLLELNRRFVVPLTSDQAATKADLFKQWKAQITAYKRSSTIKKLQQQLLNNHRANVTMFRVCCFNVHFWTDAYEKPNYQKIIQDILAIDADILLLNEVVFGAFQHEGQHINANFAEDLQSVYPKVVFCNVVPSWFSAPYGNAMLIHQRVAHLCASDLCAEMDEEIFTIPKPRLATNMYKGVVETRCFIRLKILDQLLIYGVHLDVYDKDDSIRTENIRAVMNDASQHDCKHVLILGDFNTLREDDYEAQPDRLSRIKKNYTNAGQTWKFNVVNVLRKHGYHDVFQLCPSKQIPPFTAWNMTRVDFIFANEALMEKWQGQSTTTPFVYVTQSSDHLPVVLDFRTSQG